MASFLQLVCLAAIWGASFLFMRVAAQPLGAAVLIEGRVLSAALVLFMIALYWRKKLPLATHTKHFFILGLFNTTIPFLLFAYAAQTLNVSSLSILNSTAPIWGALIGAVWTKTPLTKQVLLGLVLGVVGVAILVGWEAMDLGQQAIYPILAATGAAFCYGLATNYAKNAPKVDAFSNAHGSMWASVILVIPLLAFMPAREAVTSDIVIAVVLLGVVCTALAYLLYFKLVADLGPSSALSVTFLIPVFGIFWGHIFLDEAIGINTFVGAFLVIVGTMFVTGFSFKNLRRSKTIA